MGTVGAWWELCGGVLIESYKACGIALTQGEIGEGRSEGSGVLKLGEGTFPPESHGAGVIDEQLNSEVCLVLKLFNVVPVCFGECPPVYVTYIITGSVEFMFAKLNGGASSQGPMDPCESPRCDVAGRKVKALYLVEEGRS